MPPTITSPQPATQSIMTSATANNDVSDAEQRAIDELRQLMLTNKLTIHNDYDHELLRWCQAWKLKPDVSLVERMRLAEENANALNLYESMFAEKWRKRRATDRRLDYWPVSFAIERAYNRKGNALVTYATPVAALNFNKIAKVMPPSEIVKLVHEFNEHNKLFVQRIEKETGKRCSAHNVFDLEGINVLDYANPIGAPFQLLYCVAQIADRFYPGVVSKMYLLHPPAILSVLWEIAKQVITERTQETLVLVKDVDELKDHISINALPRCYGGTLHDDSAFVNPTTFAHDPKKITASDYYPVGLVFSELVNTPKLTSAVIKYNKTFTVTRHVRERGKWLAWQVKANNEYEFTVFHVDGDKQTRVFPSYRLYTPKIPDEGVIECTKTGIYQFEFTNTSCYWFNVKLEYAVVQLDREPPRHFEIE